MDEKKLTPKQEAFLRDPEGVCSNWLETSMARTRASYSVTARSIGVTRDALYKFANSGAPTNNIPLFRAILEMLETGDLTILLEMVDLFDGEIVPKGTMTKIKALPDASPLPTEDDRYPLYQKQPKRPLLRAMMEEASEK